MKKYPYLEIEYDDRYICLNEDPKEFNVLFHINEYTTNIINVEADIYTLDTNIAIEENKIIPFEEGLAVVIFVYTYKEILYKEEIEFVVYNTFFRENYKLHLLPEIDKINLETNIPFQVLMDTLFEFYDIIHAYKQDIIKLKEPLTTKHKFLNSLFSESGFNFTDFETENNIADVITAKVYRNLLNNLQQILEIRGTQEAYELFFNFIGYEVEILEYWFYKNDMLVETNLTYPNKSTYKLYDILGQEIEHSTETPDPKYFVNGNKLKNKYNKSNFIRIQYSLNDNLPSNYVKSRELIRKYLDWLKPKHIKYLEEIFDFPLTVDQDEEKISWLLDLDTDDIEFEGVGTTTPTQPPKPPPIEENKYTSTGKIIFKGDSYISSFSFVSLYGKINIIGSHEYISLDKYIFENTSGAITFKNSAFRQVFKNIEGKINFNGECSVEHKHLYLHDLGSFYIYWRDYLDDEYRDNLGNKTKIYYTPNVGNNDSYDADTTEFFAKDFSLNNNQTYVEDFNHTEVFEFSDTIRTFRRFDRDWQFDSGLRFDTFAFIDEYHPGVVPSNNIPKHIFELEENEIREKYLSLKELFEQEEDEIEEEYELRIKKKLVEEYIKDFNTILTLNSINQLI